jgi:hypothetical protein
LSATSAGKKSLDFMSDTFNSVQDSNDDIDLIIVLERISRFLFVNKIVLIVSAIAGLICGLAIYRSLPKTFNSTLILRTQVLSNTEDIGILSSWNDLLINGEYGALSRYLNCSPDLVSKLRSINAEIIPNPLPAISAFSVSVLVKDTTILNDLQSAIIYGLENNDYVKAKVTFKRDNTIQLITSINQEIARLDSTKRKIELSSAGKPLSSPSFIVDISNLNVQMITLREKLYLNQENLKFVDAIQVTQKFEKYEKPVSPRLSILAFSGLLGGLFIGLILSIVKTVRLKIALIRHTRKLSYPNRDLT